MSSSAMLAATTLILVVAPSVASGQGLAPPSGAEVDQYFEDAPQAKGDRSLDRTLADGGGDGVGGAGVNAVPAATANALKALGAEGKATAELAQATAPSEPIKPVAPGLAEDDDDGSALSNVLGAMSALLWLLLAATLALGITYFFWRRRSGA